ncbi:Mediator of RNA polymerase II transcription subunit 17 [Grifola frondosa]|uniref:Mediator of RNA polymerase II transcription subunit 17 n=1 Tax=Grifola frondosa TaxID=5627 RepID=A0A1C7M0B5_GRIFR|nr:Mediator of RNA polymerase II transcription subunit 17 [Grifola frondosa]
MEPPWKKLKLSLERPYKDDDGEPLPVLLDITPDGQHIYEPRDDPSLNVSEKLRRIFVERGLNFFEKQKEKHAKEDLPENTDDSSQERTSSQEPATHMMSPEELLKMRMDIMPQLHIALGEMCQARDLLSLLLSSTLSAQPSHDSASTSSILSATIVSKPPPIPSVRTFDSQLVVGGKDRALRSAAELFKVAAEGMESGRLKGEQYWIDALKIRKGNWGLIPAPLPLGSATGKGADKTSKDFLVSFGLEESPPLFRRRAIGRMFTFDAEGSLEFPLRQQTRLQVSIICTDADGTRKASQSRLLKLDDGSLEGSLRAAQAEVVEQEIFSGLIREAGNLPTASAQVSERLIIIEAAQATELRFELIDEDVATFPNALNAHDAHCDLVYWILHILLLRSHVVLKSQRLANIGIPRVQGLTLQPPPLLQPIIDVLQYRVFCERVYAELDRMAKALRQAGVPTKFQFEPVGESGEELVRLLQQDRSSPIGGETLLRIDHRHTLRFTFISPSSLTAHLPQATLIIASIPQLTQLLIDEVGGRILSRICELGSDLCDSVDGTWLCSKFPSIVDGSIHNMLCSTMDHGDGTANFLEVYQPEQGSSLMDWVRTMIQKMLNISPVAYIGIRAEVVYKFDMT